MNCAEFTEQLDEYLEDALPAALLGRFQLHVAECDGCAATAGRARMIRQGLAEYPVAPMRPGFADQVIARAARGRKSLFAGRVVAAGFVATLLLSVATVILTGLSVEAPRVQLAAGLPTVTMHVEQARVVNLVFESQQPLSDVALSMKLPGGIELADYPGQSEVKWRTSLQAGKNVLPLKLVARDRAGGQLIAEFAHGERRKVFRVHLEVSPG